jgi:hypothetical protein
MLWLGAVLSGVGVIGVLTWGVLLPVRVPEPSHRGGADATPSKTAVPGNRDAQSSDGPQVALANLRKVAAMDLRQPLYEAKQAQKQQQKRQKTEKRTPAPESLKIELIGTFLEPGHSMAMLRKQDGTIKICPEGQSIEHGQQQVTVTRVARRKATIRLGGKTHELVMPKKQN